ncbi:cyclin-like protein [Sphaerosporella brunnea]|uniref:Cyclin-like protein n=1 Tax=Sphaerosporella brunnea TaxID=1250544 RepID=A0A5J5F0U7_9PEZI|nr:cyclin-like protein [Sphaerosporella brunnea]
MQSRRAAARRRVATNDENTVAMTRLTRAKAATLSSNAVLAAKTSNAAALAAKSSNATLAAKSSNAALATKSSNAPATTTSTTTTSTTTTTTTAAANRRRAALGDVSNVHGKSDDAAKKVAVKKVVKTTITAKTTTTNAVTKAARATRPAPVKSVAATQEAKKEASGTGIVRPRKRAAPSKVKDDHEDDEDIENRAVGFQLKAEIGTEDMIRQPAAKRPRFELAPPSKPKTAAEVEGWKDLDAEDAQDPLMVSEYVNEIFEHLKKLEPETQPNPNYMDDQMDLRWQMRGILVDWLVEVHTRFRLLPETLFLAVNIVDRFLTNKIVMLEKLELVGVTAMFIAAKYEEVFSPHVKYFRHVADDGFTDEEILRAERFILATLDYNLSYPNPMNFLRRISKADRYDFQTRTFAKYLMEISLLDHRFLEYLPSHVSAAAMYMARLMLDRGPWDENLIHYSDYTEEQILPVFRLMIDYLIRPVKHQAFFKKYAGKKFMKASLHLRDWAKKNATAYGVDIELSQRDLYQDEDLYN